MFLVRRRQYQAKGGKIAVHLDARPCTLLGESEPILSPPMRRRPAAAPGSRRRTHDPLFVFHDPDATGVGDASVCRLTATLRLHRRRPK